MENKEPLELFLLPHALSHTFYVGTINLDGYKGMNTLRMVNVIPSEGFITNSIINFQANLDFIANTQRIDEASYSLCKKIFLPREE